MGGAPLGWSDLVKGWISTIPPGGRLAAVVYCPAQAELENLSPNQNHKKSRAVCRGNPPFQNPARRNNWTAVEGMASSEWASQPDPNAVADANPHPPTPADREVPIHGWRLVVAPCDLVMCACRTRAAVVCVWCWILKWWVSTANRFPFVVPALQTGSQVLPVQDNIHELAVWPHCFTFCHWCACWEE